MSFERLTYAAAFFLAQSGGSADIPQKAAPLFEPAVPIVEMSDDYQTESDQPQSDLPNLALCLGSGVVLGGICLIGYQASKAGRRTVDLMSESDPDTISLFNNQRMRKTENGYVPDESTDN